MTGNLHNLDALVAMFVQYKELSPSRMSLLIGTICVYLSLQLFNGSVLVN